MAKINKTAAILAGTLVSGYGAWALLGPGCETCVITSSLRGLVLGTPAVAAEPEAKPADKPAPKAEEKKTAGPEVGKPAPVWEAKDRDGKTVALAELKGKVVLMDFWATWCPPCKKAMPGMQALHAKYADKGLVVLGMNTWQSREGKLRGPDPKAFVDENKYTYPLVMETDAVAKQYGVRGIPAFFLVGKDGTLIHKASGYSEEGEKALETKIREALGLPAEEGKN
jgi:thiol-disulfide isomerase/thioredoxin